MFYRRPEQVVLTFFSMPAIICVLLGGSIFSAKIPGTQTSTGAVIAASMLAYGILSTSFINLGIGIAATVKPALFGGCAGRRRPRRRTSSARSCWLPSPASPRRSSSWCWGVAAFQLQLPTDVFAWFTLAWVFILGIISCSLLGILVSNFAGNAVSAAVMTNGPAVGLQFVSGGTYVPLMALRPGC